MWYRTGTVSVTNGSTTVTGSGTSWIDGAASGEGFYGPDGRLYEISAIVSATQLTLGSAYLGATVTGQAYQIVPSQSYIRSLAAQAAALVNDYAGVLSTVGIGKFSDGTLASPGIRFSSDENTGIRRVGADNLALVTNGADRVSVTSSAVAITGNLSVSGSITGTTTLASAVLTTADINGGTMDNVTIGGSTPAAGNFTTLGASGAVTLSGGTANGVLYLDGSKVATSGSALTFDGTKLGVGGNPASTGLDTGVTQAFIVAPNSNTGAAATFIADSVGRGVLVADQAKTTIASVSVSGSVVGFGANSNTPVAFNVNASEQMRLTSTGLGIGTSSPGAKLHTQAATGGTQGIVECTSGSSYLQVKSNNSAAVDAALMFTDGTNTSYFGALRGTSNGVAGALQAYTGGAIRMTLDVSGNLGIGVTPSAWGSFIPLAIELPNGVGFASQSNAPVAHFSANAYYDGSWRYKANGVAARYALGPDTHIWYTAPSGTAGNAISFTQNMSLSSTSLDVNSGYVKIGSPGTSTDEFWLQPDSTEFVLRGRQAKAMTFYTSDTERMRLDSSGNLGIGTSSPGAKLDVQGTAAVIRLKQNAAGSATYYQMDNTVETGGKIWRFGYTGGSGIPTFSLFNQTDNVLAWAADASGNFGLGVTPSAWTSAVKALQVNTTSALWANSNTMFLTNNTFTDGTDKYITTAEASRYYQAAGSHIWNTAPSGTAGAAISFTQAMTLDASGNLGIGTSSPSARFDLSVNDGLMAYFRSSGGAANDKRLTITSGGDRVILDAANNSNGAAAALAFTTGTTERMRLDSSGNLGLGVTPSGFTSTPALCFGTSSKGSLSYAGGAVSLGDNFYRPGSGYNYTTAAAATLYQQTGGVHYWFNAPSGTAGNAISFTQAMTLDASGNWMVGMTSALKTGNIKGSGLALVGSSQNTGNELFFYRADNLVMGYIGWETPGSANSSFLFDSTNGNPIAWAIGGTERARITSGGYFKASDAGTYVGSTGAYHELVSSTGSATAAVYIRNTNATSPAGIDLSYSGASPNGTGNTFLYCQDSTALRTSIHSNGGLANYSANDVNLSDRREKTNFAPAKSYLDIICAIPVQTFNYIDQSEDDPGLTLGVVAQDVQAVAPELVMESNWGTEDNPKMRLSIYQTDLQYALMKCIQEQQAIITALTARVAALETN